MEFHEHLDRIFALLWTPAHVERTVSALREGNADALVAALEGTGIVLSPAARVQLQRRAVKHAIKKAAERTRGKQGKVVSLHKKMQRMGVKPAAQSTTTCEPGFKMTFGRCRKLG